MYPLPYVSVKQFRLCTEILPRFFVLVYLIRKEITIKLDYSYLSGKKTHLLELRFALTMDIFVVSFITNVFFYNRDR